MKKKQIKILIALIAVIIITILVFRNIRKNKFSEVMKKTISMAIIEEPEPLVEMSVCDELSVNDVFSQQIGLKINYDGILETDNTYIIEEVLKNNEEVLIKGKLTDNMINRSKEKNYCIKNNSIQDSDSCIILKSPLKEGSSWETNYLLDKVSLKAKITITQIKDDYIVTEMIIDNLDKSLGYGENDNKYYKGVIYKIGYGEVYSEDYNKYLQGLARYWVHEFRKDFAKLTISIFKNFDGLIDKSKLQDDVKSIIEINKKKNGYMLYKTDNYKTLLVLMAGGQRKYITDIELVQAEWKDEKLFITIREVTSANSNNENYPYSVFQLNTDTKDIIVQTLEGDNYPYISNPYQVYDDIVKKYAPYIFLQPSEKYLPSSVDFILNKTFKIKTIPTGSFCKYTTGNFPKISINNQGDILEIHETSTSSGVTLKNEVHYRVGKLKDDNRIEFYEDKNLTTGKNPSLAINNNNIVVEVHRYNKDVKKIVTEEVIDVINSVWKFFTNKKFIEKEITYTETGIDLRLGKLNNSEVEFNRIGKIATGETPSIDINDNNLFIMTYESAGKIKYYLGSVEGNSTKELSSGSLGNGYKPSIAINNYNQLVLSYELDDRIYYQTGQINTVGIKFNKEVYLTTGKKSSVDLNDDGDVVEIHETSNKHQRTAVAKFTEILHYRYGKMQFDSNEIIFTDFIELCSGIDADIAINNNKKLVEIHQTSSITNSDLHYRNSDFFLEEISNLEDLETADGNLKIAYKNSENYSGGDLETAKAYATIFEQNDSLLIGYHLFYPYNGSNKIGEVIENESLDHIGDWERVYVLINPDGELIKAKYHYHSHAQIYGKENIYTANKNLSVKQFLDKNSVYLLDNHPLVFPSYGGHASYPNLVSSVLSGDIIDFNMSDWMGNKNFWNVQDNFELVQINTKAIKGKDWINWGGRWGSSFNSPDSKFHRDKSISLSDNE